MDPCASCGRVLERWEIRCIECAVQTAIPEDWYILIAGPSLRYRWVVALARATGALVMAFLIAGASLALAEYLQRISTGGFLSVLQVIVALGGLIATLVCLSLVYVAFSEIKTNAAFAVSKTKINFQNVVQLYDKLDDDVPSETKFTESDLLLADVRRIQVGQAWLARLLGYGHIHVFTDGTKPAADIMGVVHPHRFAESLRLIVRHLDTPASTLRPMPAPAPQAVAAPRARSAALEAREPNVADLRISLWLAIPIALAAAHVVVFLVGLVIGLVEQPMAGVLLTFALASWPIGMFAAWGIYYYHPRRHWVFRVLVAVAISILNSALLALSIYALIGRLDFALVFATLSVPIVFVGSVFYLPDPPQPFFLDLFQKSPPMSE